MESIITKHRIFYSSKELIPLNEIAESLISLERVIKLSLPVLEDFFPRESNLSVSLFVDEIKSGSLSENFIVKFFFGGQQCMNETIDTARKMLGIDYLNKHPKLFTAIMVASIVSGGIFYLRKNKIFSDPKSIERLEITSSVINIFGADLAQMTPEEFKEVIESNTKNKEQIAKNSIKILRPAQRENDASITFDDTPALSLSHETIRAMPSSIEEDSDEIIEDFNNIGLSIRTIDRDNTKKGWMAIAPSIYEKRVKLHLDPSIDPKDLMTKLDIVGDVTVLFELDENKNKVPKVIFLTKIRH